MGLLEVASHRSAALAAYDCVKVQLRLAGWIKCNVSVERQNLNLVANGDLLILLGTPVPVGQNSVPEGLDRRHLRSRELLVLGQALKTGADFVTRFEHGDKRAKTLSFMKEAALRAVSPAVLFVCAKRLSPALRRREAAVLLQGKSSIHGSRAPPAQRNKRSVVPRAVAATASALTAMRAKTTARNCASWRRVGMSCCAPSKCHRCAASRAGRHTCMPARSPRWGGDGALQRRARGIGRTQRTLAAQTE